MTSVPQKPLEIPERLKDAAVELEQIDDALNWLRGHLVRDDPDAALNSLGDASLALQRLEDILEDL